MYKSPVVKLIAVIDQDLKPLGPLGVETLHALDRLASDAKHLWWSHRDFKNWNVKTYFLTAFTYFTKIYGTPPRVTPPKKTGTYCCKTMYLPLLDLVGVWTSTPLHHASFSECSAGVQTFDKHHVVPREVQGTLWFALSRIGVSKSSWNYVLDLTVC